MKFTKSIQISILLFIIGSLFAQSAYTAPPLQDQPALVYEDFNYGYLIDYPSDWSAEITLENRNALASEIVIDQRTAFRGGTEPRVTVDVWRNDSNKSLQEWFDKYQKPLLIPGDLIPTEPNARIANEEAFFSVEFYEGKNAANFALLLAHGEYIYRIEYYAIDGGVSADSYRDMLLSLRFSDSVTVDANLLPKSPDLEPSPNNTRESNCCGYYSSGNPYSCSGGNCVWWARYKRPDTGYGNGSTWGNAQNWDDRAVQEGFDVRSTPAVGAIAVSNTFSPPYGHVVYVKSYNSTTITVSEMNWITSIPACTGSRVRLDHAYQRSHFQNYIYETPSDTTPPTTTAALSGTAGEDNWYRSNVQVTLSATDNSGGSGVKRIYVKWDDGATWLWYINPFTISGEGVHTVTYKAEDNAGNFETEKQTLFGIDSTVPTGSLGINNDASVTHATLVSLNTSAADNLSGVSQMRARDAGDTWDDWQSYTAAPLWLLPGPTGQTFGVGVQFKDRAGNESGVYTDTIPLDIYPDQPASAGYRLQKTTLGMSGGPSVSTNYQLRGTLGQPSAVNVMSDTNYVTAWGYWRTASVASPAQAGFTAAPISGVIPLTVTFVNTSTGDYDSSLWNFGDGVSSALISPTHTYTSAGVYTVALTVSGTGGTDTLTRATYITATAPPIPVQVDFTASPLAGSAPLTVTFTDVSTGDITSWQWDFGDGSSSATQNPDHAYAAAGSYTVTLTVNGPNGSDAEVKTGYIQVSDDPVIANFTANPTSGEAPLDVQFTDVSSGDLSVWQWSFGDGESSALQHPSHTYQASGVYTVSLFVNGLGGTGNLVKTGYINITPASADNNIYLPLILK